MIPRRAWLAAVLSSLLTTMPALGQILNRPAPGGNDQALEVLGVPASLQNLELRITTAPNSSVTYIVAAATGNLAIAPGTLLVEPSSVLALVTVPANGSGVSSITGQLADQLPVGLFFTVQGCIARPDGVLRLTNRSEVFVLAPVIPPQLFLSVNPVVSPTAAASVALSGVASTPGSTISIAGGSTPTSVTANQGAGGNEFATSLSLVPNAHNTLYLTETTPLGVALPPVTVAVIQDSTPPALFIDFPADASQVTTDVATVGGRVSDLLSGFMGLDVTVNGAPAAVDVGIGTNGTYHLAGVSVDPAGMPTVITVTATDAVGNTTTRQVTVTRVFLGGPQMVIASGDDQSGQVGTGLTSPLEVLVTGASGLPFPNKLVRFAVVRSNGRLSATGTEAGTMVFLVQTDSSGLARAFLRLGSDAGCGNDRVLVTSNGINGEVLFSASALPAPAAQINIGSGDNQRAGIGAPVPSPLEVWVNDGVNGIGGVPVAFSVTEGGGYLTGAGAVPSSSLTVVTDATGHAHVSFTLGTAPVTNRVRATFSGDPGPPAVFAARAVAPSASGTVFRGVVLDNSQRAIQGATCDLTVAGQTFGPVATDIHGRFEIAGVSVSGPGHLDVQGATACHLGGPTGQAILPGTFPELTFQVLVVPSSVNSLPGPVLLPVMQPQNTFSYDGVSELVLGIDGIAGLQMIVAPGSMSIDGSPAPAGTVISLNQVHRDSLPKPMPDGASPPLAWTIQPHGATFDPPIQIRYPNMGGLPAGSIVYFLSYNHDTEQFEIIATGQVTTDGSCAVTDTGSGISVSGWGGICPPYPPTCDVDRCPLDEAKERLREEANAQAAAGSSTSALAEQIACLAEVACGRDPSQPPGTPFGPRPPWTDDFVVENLMLIADNLDNPLLAGAPTTGILPILFPRAGGVAETLCNILPGGFGIPGLLTANDVCSVLAGLGRHFPFELLPGFIRNCDLLTPQGCANHQMFLENAVVPCFPTTQFSPWVGDVAAGVVPTLAGGLRDTIKFFCGPGSGPQLASLAAPGTTLPPMPIQAELAVDFGTSPTLNVDAGGAFFLTVGTALQLNVTNSTGGSAVDVTQAATGTIYAVSVTGNAVTVTPDGLLTVGGTISPLPNLPTMVYVVAQNGSDFGAAQFAIVDQDTDGDFIVDSFEVKVGLDPMTPNLPGSDQDGDGLDDVMECLMGSDPLSSDTDSDGVDDCAELLQRSDYLDPTKTTPTLDDRSVVEVNGRNGTVERDGSFSVSNVPISNAPARVRVTSSIGGVSFYGGSDFFMLDGSGDVVVPDIPLQDTPLPEPISLVAVAANGLLVDPMSTTQLNVTAQFSDGTSALVNTLAAGTAYTSTNPAIATIDQDGIVTPINNGAVFITARNEGLTAVERVTVSLGDPLTTVEGFVQLQDGTPVAGASVTISGITAGTTSAADGAFSIPSVPTQLGALTVTAQATIGGELLLGANSGIVPEPSDLTDGGIVVLAASQCFFDSVLGPDLGQGDDDFDFIDLTSMGGFVFYGTTYTGAFVNSNGNITFGGGATDWTPSIGEAINGPARICPAWFDLNPGAGGSVHANPLVDRTVITWNAIPEFPSFGVNTIQATLYTNGQIDVVYNGLTATGATGQNVIVSISPGNVPPLDQVDYSTLLAPFAGGTGAATAELFNGANLFDLDMGCVRFVPNPAGGYDASFVPAFASVLAATVRGVVRNLPSLPTGITDIVLRSSADVGWVGRAQMDADGSFACPAVPCPGAIAAALFSGTSVVATGSAVINVGETGATLFVNPVATVTPK